MPKSVNHGGFYDEHNCSQRDSISGPCALRSGMLPLRPVDDEDGGGGGGGVVVVVVMVMMMQVEWLWRGSLPESATWTVITYWP